VTSAVRDVVVEADGIPLSALVAEPSGAARAVVLCLHGGGMRASYFHGQAHPDVSLLDLAAMLGYCAISLDRPGYGASTAALPGGLSLSDQAVLTRTALPRLAGGHRDAPLFLVGHSFGMMLSLQLAATDDGQLCGLDCSGAGVRYNRELSVHPGRTADDGTGLTTEERIELFWGSRRLYPPGTFDRKRRGTAPVPAAEVTASAEWSGYFPVIAPDVRVPVQYTMADHERWWDLRPTTLEELRRMLSASPRLEIRSQVDAGHNISLGWTARSYHLRALAFAGECARVGEARLSGR
jgi:pimeloyl-ACP methyl ester carboxylesterase